MATIKKSFLLIIVSISVIFSQVAFAARFGGGRSRGMQRPQPTYNTQAPQQHNSYNQAPNPNNNNFSNNPQPAKSGMGAGTAAILGAAAGAAGGYMLGKSASNEPNSAASSATQNSAAGVGNNASPINQQSESKFPWGIIGILGFILVIALIFFKKKARPEFENQQRFSNSQPKPPFSIPGLGKNFRKDQNQVYSKQNTDPNMGIVNNPTEDEAINQVDNKLMPDGIEKLYFLRQAKGIFLHIQSMNNTENLDEIAKYLTPELYNEIKDEIANNHVVADFYGLNCILIDTKIENNQLFASVRFDGMINEDPKKPAQPFKETWNFIKPDFSNSNKWLVAGIQQDNAEA